MKNGIGFTHVLLGTSKMLVGGCVELLIVHILTPILHSLCKVYMVCRLIQCMFCDYRTESGPTELKIKRADLEPEMKIQREPKEEGNKERSKERRKQKKERKNTRRKGS